MKLKVILINFLILFPIIGFTQWNKGISIEPTLHVGKIFKHTSSLLFPVENLSTGIELNITNKKYGRKSWHQQLNYPKGGISLFYFHLGDNDLFGQAFGIAPNIIFPIFRKKRLDSNFQLGWGIAYVTRSFDPIRNPENNALGSNLNSLNTFKWQLGYQVNSKWKVNLGASFTHYSNGASQLPNFGINVPAISLGTIFTPNPIKEEDIIIHEIKPLEKRWGLTLNFGYASTELTPIGGPSYPFYVASLAGIYRLSAVRELSFGFDYEYDKAVYTFGLHTSGFINEAAARRASTRLGVFVAHEFLLGNVGLYGQLGTYIPGFDFSTAWFIYTKLGMRYYLPGIGKNKSRFYFGVHLKSHRIIAEYLSFGIGVRL